MFVIILSQLDETIIKLRELEKLVIKQNSWDFYVNIWIFSANCICLKFFDLKVNFNVSEEILHSNIVGKLSYKKTCEKQNKHVKVKLENREFQVKNLEVLPVDICVLPNKKLLCANSKPWNLTLYDETLC